MFPKNYYNITKHYSIFFKLLLKTKYLIGEVKPPESYNQ